jgi:hypothetical protein
MTLAILLVVVVPVLLAVVTIVEHSDDIAGWTRSIIETGVPQPPAWVEEGADRRRQGRVGMADAGSDEP